MQIKQMPTNQPDNGRDGDRKCDETDERYIIIIIINNITNLLTGYTFQHRHAVINMCPVKE